MTLLQAFNCFQARDQGFKVELAGADEKEDAETWEEAMAEVEDHWMAEPPAGHHKLKSADDV